METALSSAAKSADFDPFVSNDPERFDGISELQPQEALLKTGVLQERRSTALTSPASSLTRKA